MGVGVNGDGIEIGTSCQRMIGIYTTIDWVVGIAQDSIQKTGEAYAGEGNIGVWIDGFDDFIADAQSADVVINRRSQLVVAGVGIVFKPVAVLPWPQPACGKGIVETWLIPYFPESDFILVKV